MKNIIGLEIKTIYRKKLSIILELLSIGKFYLWRLLNINNPIKKAAPTTRKCCFFDEISQVVYPNYGSAYFLMKRFVVLP